MRPYAVSVLEEDNVAEHIELIIAYGLELISSLEDSHVIL